MFRRLLVCGCLVLALPALGAETGPKEQIKQEFKKGGKAVGGAAVKVGHAVRDGAKAVGHGVKRGAKKVGHQFKRIVKKTD